MHASLSFVLVAAALATVSVSASGLNVPRGNLRSRRHGHHHPHHHRHGHHHGTGDHHGEEDPPSDIWPIDPPAGNYDPPSVPELANPYAGNWTWTVRGTSGVSAQQMAVVDEDHVLIIDKVEANPLQVNGHPAWGAIYTISNHALRPLNVKTNSFCAGGSFLGNGTMVSIGGNENVYNNEWGNTVGLQSLRLFTPCGNGTCDIYDNLRTHSMIAKRWYPSTVRMQDGGIFIAGGCHVGGFFNDASQNEPTFEYFPRRSNSLVFSPFLNQTLNANLFPMSFLLPSGLIFMAANNRSMLYNPVTNTERRLPNLPNGVRISYPMSGSGLLLPLSKANHYTPEVLICGGSTFSDQDRTGKTLSSHDPASKQCQRMVLTEAGIAAGWQVEQMPLARHMGSMAMLPDGKIVIVNGAQTGFSSFRTVPDPVGDSNADDPAYQPLLYDYTAPSGSRFSTTGMPPTTIPRMYHSTATLAPSGEVLVSGSNPHLNVTYNVIYPSEYRVEFLTPPYVTGPRATISTLPSEIGFNQEFQLTVDISKLTTRPLTWSVTLNDLGFSTHGTQMNARNVVLDVHNVSISGQTATLSVQSAPHSGIYPPGPGWLSVIANGVPSALRKTLIGNGSIPAGV